MSKGMKRLDMKSPFAGANEDAKTADSVRRVQAHGSCSFVTVMKTLMIAILAAGIGLNTAVYSVLYGILLRPYPYASPERIVGALQQLLIRVRHRNPPYSEYPRCTLAPDTSWRQRA